MFLLIFFCYSTVVMTSANNGIPTQTYPTYQQNGYTHPHTNQPSNLQPYTQGIAVQNQQQLNLSPLIKQALLNRLVNTNPTVQAILDPNAASYNSNLNGMNNHVPIDSYVATTESIKNNADQVIAERKLNESRNTGKSKRKRSKPKRKQNGILKDEDNLNEIKPVTEVEKTNTENHTKSRKKSRKNNRSDNEATELQQDTKSDTQNNKTKKSKTKSKDRTTKSPIEKENKDQNAKTRRRRRKKKVKQNSETVNEVSTNKENDTLKHKSTEIKDNVDLDITDGAMNNDNRTTRNLIQEANALKTIPSTPKEISNYYLNNLNQVNNPLMSNWFANYENLYQSLLANQPTTIEVKPKRRRKPKTNKKPKIIVQTNNSTETPPVATTIAAIDSSTTESVTYDYEKTETNFNSNPTELSLNLFDTENKNQKQSSNEIFNDGYNIDEFQERHDSGAYGGYIDDYYPFFTDSAAYNANNKEIILKNLNDNKYYYTTDRIEPDLPKQYQNTKNGLKTKELLDYEIKKHTYDEAEKESIRKAYEKYVDNEEILQFHTPPILESPDFRTRQVDKSVLTPAVYYNIDEDGTEGKSSYSSNAKATTSGVKPNKIKHKTKDIETFYAKSKVASYSPVYSQSEDRSDDYNPWIGYSYASDSFRDGDTTYVIAKTIDDPELY